MTAVTYQRERNHIENRTAKVQKEQEKCEKELNTWKTRTGKEKKQEGMNPG